MKTVVFLLLLMITAALGKKESPTHSSPPNLKCNDYADLLSPTRLVLLGLAMILLGLKQSPLMRMTPKDSGCKQMEMDQPRTKRSEVMKKLQNLNLTYT